MRIETEPAFGRLVADWERRFAALIAQIDPAAVPAHLWPRLRSRLGWSPVEGAPPRGLWNSVGLWRATAALAAALAVVALLFDRAPAPTPPPLVQQPPVRLPPVEAEPTRPVTRLARDDGSTGWLATVDRRQSKVLMAPVPGPGDAQGRIAERRLIPKGEAPRSLGLVSTQVAHSVPVPADLLSKRVAGATLAISLEPPTGVPHSAPTGPIIAKGGLSR
ncbi:MULTISPECIES: anti-sigma factor [unclassified Lysobacter]|uniref:anti-sigma factor n=1 Tax=unclassified Lysobacter TaxID=2635362 RepID=UPI001BE8188E|nr:MULTISPECIES: anti-sigma factor [unclassified Lysobacter]MBT2747529.1 anti-sigma factor [Lysobacter sp. ISL-42]MBT2752352.1 anti-sigma factor [Lysobacter sp. ISL-50]MBT2776229.1 anti-sigma factor [Lysobacter sp. ISL-54]MBT2784313.1 anti-sigma factor [Lysobacter sp. ISL-52]